MSWIFLDLIFRVLHLPKQSTSLHGKYRSETTSEIKRKIKTFRILQIVYLQRSNPLQPSKLDYEFAAQGTLLGEKKRKMAICSYEFALFFGYA